jgi:purine-nucleoside phosphorylase
VATETHDPYETAVAAAERLAELTGTARHDVALVLGSGWGPAAEQLGATVTELRMSELPGFAPPSAVGHAGLIRSVRVGDRGRALVFLGRTHLYEGHGVASVVHGVRTATAAGCRTVVLTNGCGGVRADLTPGQPVLISDHVNLTATSPLVGSRFVDLTDLYATRLRERCREIDPSLAEGVYAQLPGPHYETPAEIRMLATLGVDLVGMSTTLEAIAAREGGAEVLGVSLVTNLAAGLSGAPLDHAEVLATGKASAARVGGLLARVLPRVIADADAKADEGRDVR